MDIGQLYDRAIASTYDHDEWGLLSGARAVAFRQIGSHLSPGQVHDVLDLAVGTGESLVEMKQRFPDAALHGIDLSEEMLRIARDKLSFDAVHDDVANVGEHFSSNSMNLVLMHFLTTFVNGAEVVANTAGLLQAGGYYSIVSSTFEAFPRIYALARTIFPDEFIRSKNPAPENAETVAAFCSDVGLEVVAVERFTKPVRFGNFKEFYDFGMNSGFFTHVLSHLDEAQLAGLSRMENVFPLEDHYCGSIVLARKAS